MVSKRVLSALLSALFVLAPIGAAAQQQDASQYLRTNPRDPLRVFQLTIEPGNGSIRVCFAFQNLTAQAVSSARFHFAIVDQFGTEALGRDFVRNTGSPWGAGQSVFPPDTTARGFADTNDGSQSCWVVTNNGQSLSGLSNNSRFAVTVTGLSYDNGSVWHTGQTFRRAYNADGSAYVYTPPQFDTQWSTVTDSAPVAITNAGVRAAVDRSNTATMQLCATFRTVTNKVASSVKINYAFSDASRNAVNADWVRADGTFTPPILIENKCWAFGYPGEATVRRMKNVVVYVSEVHFTDGSSWTSGQQYVKAFDAGGSAVAGTPMITPAATPTTTAKTTTTVTTTNSAVQPNLAVSAGALQIGCTPTKGGNPVVITIDATNQVVARIAGPGYQESGKQVTAHGYFSATQISWTWPLTDSNGNIEQDSWTLDRSTLKANERNGAALYQCSRNQI